jgi:hypothetical protein
MRKLASGMLLGFGAALIGWWFYKQSEADSARSERGEVIFRNTPLANPEVPEI